jgi:ATP-dependent DNA ligase
MPLLMRRLPFDDADWLFELKYDGFRALAVIEDGPRSTDLSQRASVRLMFGRLSGRA